MCAFMCAGEHICVEAFVRARVCLCERAYVRVCVCVSVCACVSWVANVWLAKEGMRWWGSDGAA